MLIHPWDSARDEAEWLAWMAGRDFGHLVVNGLPGEPPYLQPLHFAYDHGRREAVTHLARANPLWPALEADPHVTLGVTGDHVYVPSPWQAPEGAPPEAGVPTSYYTSVQLLCTARIADDPQEKALVLRRQLGRLQPEGGHAPVEAGAEPYGRLLPGIRGIVLEVREVRAKFKYGGNKSAAVQRRVTGLLAERGGPGDAAAREHQLRRAPRPDGD